MLLFLALLLEFNIALYAALRITFIYFSLGLKRNIQNQTRDLWTMKEQTSLSDFFNGA